MRFEWKFSVLILLFVCLGALTLLRTEQKQTQWLFETASRLQGAGFETAAVSYYERYVFESDLSKEQRAKVAFLLGELYERQAEPQKALAWYYLADASKSEVKDQAAKRIVALLEQLGNSSAAKAELSKQTALQAESVPQGAVVVAQIGDKKLYRHDLNFALDRLPEKVREQFVSQDGMRKFLEQYVASELLFQKGKRQGFDEEIELKKELDHLKRQWVVQKVMTRDVLSDMKVDPVDLKNFYEANKARYAKGGKTPTFEDALEQVKQEYQAQKINSEMQKVLSEAVAGEQVKLFAERLKK